MIAVITGARGRILAERRPLDVQVRTAALNRARSRFLTDDLANGPGREASARGALDCVDTRAFVHHHAPAHSAIEGAIDGAEIIYDAGAIDDRGVVEDEIARP